jgi:hypothetical protein
MILHSVYCAGLSNFSVRGALRRHFSRQVAQLFRRKFQRENKCPISLHSEHTMGEARGSVAGSGTMLQ